MRSIYLVDAGLDRDCSTDNFSLIRSVVITKRTGKMHAEIEAVRRDSFGWFFICQLGLADSTLAVADEKSSERTENDETTFVVNGISVTVH